LDSAIPRYTATAIALHAAAAFKYWLYDRNGVFQRMLPGRRAGHARPAP